MAADRSGPWSRWDGFSGGVNQINPMVPSSGNYQFDAPQQMAAAQTSFLGKTLVDTKINTIDPSYYDCIYQIANSAQAEIMTCYKDIGCCADGCCKNSAWHTKYSWAVALIVIFCVIVIIATVISLCCWLVNRSKDKQQKRRLMADSGMSPSTSQLSLAQPIQGGYHFGTGPYQNPPGSGYRY